MIQAGPSGSHGQGHSVARPWIMASGSVGKLFVAANTHSHVTQSGLIAVVKAVKKHGIPDACSARTLKRGRDDYLPSDTPLGPLWIDLDVRMKDGQVKKMPAVSPAALWWTMTSQCPQFTRFVEARMEANPMPWRVALYLDEVLPGNPLKPENYRRFNLCIS